MNQESLIKNIRKRLKTMCMMFLAAATICPLILGIMLAILYFQGIEGESFKLILITFAIAIPIQISLALFMYFRYWKIYKLSNEKFIETSFYKNFAKEFYILNYTYNDHEIEVKNGLDYTTLAIDGEDVNSYLGNRVKNFKIESKIGNDIVIVKYNSRSRQYSVYYNQIELKEKARS